MECWEHGHRWRNGEPIAVDMMIEKRYGEHIHRECRRAYEWRILWYGEYCMA